MAEQETPKSVFDPYKVIKHPLSTEKSIRQIEFDNKFFKSLYDYLKNKKKLIK